jgi:hypothetical protein
MAMKGRGRVIRLPGTGIENMAGVIEDLIKPKEIGIVTLK